MHFSQMGFGGLPHAKQVAGKARSIKVSNMSKFWTAEVNRLLSLDKLRKKPKIGDLLAECSKGENTFGV